MLGTLHYAGGTLDRDASRRREEAWLSERLRDPASRVLPLWRDRNLVEGGDAPRPVALPAGPRVLERAGEVAYLGIDAGGRACFAADFSGEDEGVLADMTDGAQFVELRSVGALIDRADGALLAFARGLLHWHRRHGFCGVCGALTQSREGGHLRACTDAACGAHHFPRTDPAVIMLVIWSAPDGPRGLLARQARWPTGMMSTLAGFVEPGESLEDAVAREVREETGIRIARVRYRASQPWPFPSSLMIGFRAEAVDGSSLRFDPEELEDARWFSREEIAGHRVPGVKLPGRDSIARRLIEEWLSEGGGAKGAQMEDTEQCGT